MSICRHELGGSTPSTSPAIPTLHNVSQRRRRRTKPRPRSTCAEYLAKFDRVVCEILKRTDKQTDKQTGKQIHSS